MQLVLPDFEMQLYDTAAALELIDEHYGDSELPRTYRYFVEERVVTADLLRLAAVGAIGGFYADTEVLAYASFEPLASVAASFQLVDSEGRGQARFGRVRSRREFTHTRDLRAMRNFSFDFRYFRRYQSST